MNNTHSSKENILILYALQAEYIPFPEHQKYNYIYINTGIGKVNAALATHKAIMQHTVSAAINIGSCGSEQQAIDSIHASYLFEDRDLQRLKDFGLAYRINSSNLKDQHPLLAPFHSDIICNTGDSFVSQIQHTTHLYDMEAYAIAQVCQSCHLPFIAIKCVSDIVGQNSVRTWENKLSDVRSQLVHFVAKHFAKA